MKPTPRHRVAMTRMAERGLTASLISYQTPAGRCGPVSAGTSVSAATAGITSVSGSGAGVAAAGGAPLAAVRASVAFSSSSRSVMLPLWVRRGAIARRSGPARRLRWPAVFCARPGNALDGAVVSCEDDAVSARAETTSPVMDMVDLTPVEPGAGVPPWRDPRWLAEAVAWIDERLGAVGLRRSSIPALRGRMWSVVARVPVGAHGTVWFKANPPGSAFEPGLIAALGQWAPGMVPPVLAVDTERAWMLASDAGSRLHEVLDRDPDPAHLIPVLQRYARLQRDLSTRTGELLALGVPDLRPTTLPERLETLLADQALLAAIGETRSEALHGFLPKLRERCAQLDAFG